MHNDIKTTMTLVMRAKAGEDQALDLLLQHYLNRILRIVRMKLGPRLRTKMESMDVVQEVMTRAIKGFENFKPENEAAFLHWISKLVQNEIRDLADYHGAAKRDLTKEAENKKDSSIDCSVLSNIPANSEWRPSFQIRLKEEVLELEAAMDQLSEKQRDVIVMRQYEELSFKEIGKELECSEDAARMQFARAMDRLTNLMTNK